MKPSALPLALALSLAPGLLTADDTPAPLAIGAAAPDFKLPGIDGKLHGLHDFDKSPVLVVMFTAVHCPTAEIYEGRMKKLVADYKDRGVAFVVIQPNSPKALRLDEMGYTDLGDSLEDMKVRAEYRHFNFPFLYDGETQEISRKYGPVATPHVFVFDKDRKLRYQGRIDSSQREVYAKVPDARNAIDAVLAGKPVAVEKTPTVGCSVKWAYKQIPAGSRSETDRARAGDTCNSRVSTRCGNCAPTRPARPCWSTSGPPGAAPAPTSSPSCRRCGACTASARSIW